MDAINEMPPDPPCPQEGEKDNNQLATAAMDGAMATQW